MSHSMRNGGRRARWTAAAAAGLLTVAVAGCSAGAAPTEEGITLQVFGPNSTQILAGDAPPEVQQRIEQEVIDGFLAEHPEVAGVVWDAEGERGNSTQRLITAQLAEQQMDIIACDANGTNSSYARNGALRPWPQEFVDSIEDRVLPAALADYTIGGDVFGIPTSPVSILTMYYNIDLFESLGLEPPATYEDLQRIAPQLKGAGAEPLVHEGASPALWAIWYMAALAETQEDPAEKAYENVAGTAKFTDPSDVEAFAVIQRWTADGMMAPGSLGLDRSGMIGEFAAGRAAMLFHGSFISPTIAAAVTDFEWGVTPFPVAAGAGFGPRYGSGPDRGMCLAATIDESRLPAAQAFVEYLLREDVANLYLEAYSPIKSSVLGVTEIDTPWAQDLRADNYPKAFKYLDWIWPSEVTAAINAAMQGIATGELDPQGAAARVQEAFDKAVADGSWSIG